MLVATMEMDPASFRIQFFIFMVCGVHKNEMAKKKQMMNAC
jgi:hypothetical protein